MRPCEWLLAALTIVGSLALVVQARSGSRPALLAPLFCLVALSLFTVHTLREGAHWQMIPLYVATILAAILLARPSSPWLSTIPITLTAASIALAWALPVFHLPTPTGPYAVGTRTLHLTDPSRHREVVAQLWYPSPPIGPLAPYINPAEIKSRFRYFSLIRTNSHQDAPIADGPPIPILLFGPMWGGRRTQYTFLAEDLASHGYLVAAIDHPGNAALVQLASGTVIPSAVSTALQGDRTAAQISSIWNHELTVWLQDDRLVLDSLLASPVLGSHLDPTRIGAFGHSFGGAAALNLLGHDPRVLSAINLDGWAFDGLSARTTQPVLFLYEALPAQTDPYPEVLPTGDGAEEILGRMDQTLVNTNVQRFGGSIAYIQGSQHPDFTDQTLVSPLQRLTYTGPIAGARMRMLVRTLVLSFFDQTVKDRSPQPVLPDFPELRWTAGAPGSTHTAVPLPVPAGQ